MPVVKARGGHAFSAATCAPPDLEAEVDEGVEGSGGRASVGLTEGLSDDLMDINKEVDSSTLVSQSTFCQPPPLPRCSLHHPLWHQASLPGRKLSLSLHHPNRIPKCHPPITLKHILLFILQVMLVVQGPPQNSRRNNWWFTKCRDWSILLLLLAVILWWPTWLPKFDRTPCICCNLEKMDSPTSKKFRCIISSPPAMP